MLSSQLSGVRGLVRRTERLGLYFDKTAPDLFPRIVALLYFRTPYALRPGSLLHVVGYAGAIDVRPCLTSCALVVRRGLPVYSLPHSFQGEDFFEKNDEKFYQVWIDSPWRHKASYLTPFHRYTFDFCIVLCRIHHELSSGTKKSKV